MTQPWEKDGICENCGKENCGFDRYAQWKAWFYDLLEEDSELENLSEIALCELYIIMVLIGERQ